MVVTKSSSLSAAEATMPGKWARSKGHKKVSNLPMFCFHCHPHHAPTIATSSRHTRCFDGVSYYLYIRNTPVDYYTTLHVFHTHPTLTKPIPIPTKYLYLYAGSQVLKGMGRGHPKMTLGCLCSSLKIDTCLIT